MIRKLPLRERGIPVSSSRTALFALHLALVYAIALGLTATTGCGLAATLLGDKKKKDNPFLLSNAEPSVYVAPISGSYDNLITITYLVTDPDGNPVDLSVEYTTDDIAWQAATGASSSPLHDGDSNLNASPSGEIYRFVWDSITDIPGKNVPACSIRLTVTDLPGPSLDPLTSSPTEAGPFAVFNNTGPRVDITAPVGGDNADTVSSSVLVVYDIYDDEFNNVSVTVHYSIDGGINFYNCTESGDIVDSHTSEGLTNLSSNPAGFEHYFVWDTIADVGQALETNVKLRIACRDEDTGTPDETGVFTVDNNKPPAVINVVTPPDNIGGTFPIQFTLVDNASDLASIEVWVSLDSGNNYDFQIVPAAGSPPTDNLATTPTGRNHYILWDSETFVQGVVESNVRVKVDVWDITRGCSGYTNIFIVNNDPNQTTPTPPLVSIVTPIGQQSDDVTISYTLYDAQEDDASIWVEYSVDGGQNFSNATEFSGMGDGTTGLSTSTTGVDHTYVWDSKADMGTTSSSQVVIRITPSDIVAGQGGAAATDEFTVNNNAVSRANVLTPGSGNSGDITIDYTLIDADNDLLDILVQWSTDGINFDNATEGAGGDGTIGLASSAAGFPHVYSWDSLVDTGKQNVSGIIIRIIPYDLNGLGIEGESNLFDVNNNEPPIVTALVDPGQNGGNITIQYTLADSFSHATSITIDFTNDSGANWYPCTEQTGISEGKTGLETSPAGIPHFFIWNSTSPDDIGSGPGASATVQIRIIPNDDDFGDNKTTSSFLVDNTLFVNQPPSVAIAQPTEETMEAAIFYQLADQDSDLVGIVIEYSTDGTNFFNCSESSGGFSQGKTGLTTTPSGKNHVFIWDSFTDIGAVTEGSVRIRITPFDANLGCAFTTGPFIVRNNDVPTVTVITPSGAQTGEVFLSYTIVDTNSDPAAVEVTYSADAGTTWYAASKGTGGDPISGLATSPSGEGHVFVWDSRADLGDILTSNIRLRVIASDTAAGPPAATSIFTINNNTPPVAVITTSAGTFSGEISINYILSDSVQDNVSVFAQYKIGAGGTWWNASAAVASEPVSGISASPTGAIHTFIWDSAAQFGATETTDVYFRILPYDADFGTEVVIGPFLVDNNDIPVIFITAPAPTVSGLVDIEYILYDNNSDSIDVVPQFSLDGLNWYNATRHISGGDGTTGLSTEPFPAATTYYFRWDTDTDVGEAYEATAYFRIRPYDTNAGELDEVGPFIVNNNSLPAVTISTPASPQTDGTVVVSYRIYDNAYDICSIYVEYTNDSGASWYTCSEDIVSPYNQGTAGLSSRSTANGGAVHLFAWDSLDDGVGNSAAEAVSVRLRANDGQGNGSWAESNPFNVDNTGFAGATPPNVSVSDVTGIQSGDVLLRYILTDAQSDLVDIVVEYSVDGGAFQNATERPGSPSQGKTNLASASFPVNHIFVWNSVTDLGNTNSNSVVIRITPSDAGAGAGSPDNSNLFELYNNTPPEIVIIPMTAITGNAAVSFNIYDANSDNVSATVYYSTDGGTIFLPAELGVAGGNFSLSSAPGGVLHSIYWDTDADLPAVNTPGVILKMVPYDNHGTGADAVCTPFMVSNVVASKAVAVLPGQTWTEGAGVSGSPDIQIAGVPFIVDIRAVTLGETETFYAYSETLNLTTDDSYDIEPGSKSFDNGVVSFTVTNVTADLNRSLAANSSVLTNVSSAYRVDPGNASQLVIVLPGQALLSGQGVSGIPNIEHVSVPLSNTVKIYATDENFNVDINTGTSVFINSSDATASVADRNGVNPGQVTLVSGSGSMNNSTSDFIFGSTGNHVIYAFDVSGTGLQAATSSSVQVIDVLTFFGNVSTLWNEKDNWSPSIVPNGYSDVIISKDALNTAVLVSDVAVKSLVVEDSATIDLSGHDLVAHGDMNLDCGGTLQAGGANIYIGGVFTYDPAAVLTTDALTIVHFNRSGTQVLPNGVPFTNVYIECTTAELGGIFNATSLTIRNGSELELTADAYMDSHVDIQSGATLNGQGWTLTVSGDWTGTGNYLFDNASVVVFCPTSPVNISGAEQFNHMFLDGSNTLKPGGNLEVNGNLTIFNGTLDIGANTVKVRGDLTVNDTVTSSGGTLTFDGGEDQKWTGTPSSENFGNVQVNKSGGTLLPMRPFSVTSITLSNGTFDCGPYNHVLGDFTVTGGRLKMDSDSDVLNCSNITFSGGNTASITTGRLRVSGNLDIQVSSSFTPAGGVVEFHGLTGTVSQAAGNFFAHLDIVLGDLSASTALIINGNLEVGECGSLTTSSDITVVNVCDIPGTMTLTSGKTLSADTISIDGELAFDGTISVGSLIELSGKLRSITGDDLISSIDTITPARYAFMVNTSADLDIVGTTIAYTDSNGMQILGVPTFTTFSMLNFENAAVGSNHMTINADADLTATWNFFDFDGSFVPGGHNISLQANGHNVEITMVNYSGPGAGEGLDEETGGGLVLWSGRPSVEITPIVTEQGVQVTIDYTLFDADGDNCTIYPEYSPDGGFNWFIPSETGGDGTTNLLADGAGIAHTFIWNAVLDLGTVDNNSVRFRITPADAGGNGSVVLTSNFHVDANDIPAASMHGNIVPVRLPVNFTPVPGKRRGHTITYDPVADRLIMIGGASRPMGCGGYVTDVWEFDMDIPGSPWKRIYPGGAIFTPRARHSAIFDEVSNRIIVCGGENGASAEFPMALDFSSDQENGSWVSLDPVGAGPADRFGHSAVFDLANWRMILFGGYKTPTRYDDVWELNLIGGGNGSWTLLAPGGDTITARNYHVAAYDLPSQRMLVYGGFDGSTHLSETWALSLAGGGDGTWQQMSPSGTPPEGRIHTGATYDPFLRCMVIIGGTPDGTNVTNSLALLSTIPGSEAWKSSKVNAFEPTPAYSLAAAYMPRDSVIVTFGGQDSSGTFDETVAYSVSRTGVSEWEFKEAIGNSPGRYTRGPMVFDPVGGRLLLFGGWLASTGVSDRVWQLDVDLGQWQELFPSGSWTARYAHSAVYDSARRRVLVFGGLDGSGLPLVDVEVLDISGGGNGSWVPVVIFNAPPSARYNHASVFDTAADRMVVFGGTDGGNSFSDTFFLEFNGGANGSWQSTALVGPAAQEGMAAVYNPYRREMLLLSNALPASETWILELAPVGSENWMLITPAGDPVPRLTGSAAAFMPHFEGAVLFGGYDLDAGAYENRLFTFYYDGNDGNEEWVQQDFEGSAPWPRAGASCAFIPHREMFITAGGDSGAILADADLWVRSMAGNIPGSSLRGNASIFTRMYDPESDNVSVTIEYSPSGGVPGSWLPVSLTLDSDPIVNAPTKTFGRMLIYAWETYADFGNSTVGDVFLRIRSTDNDTGSWAVRGPFKVDNTLPVISTITQRIDLDPSGRTIDIEFSEKLESYTAEQLTNYSVSGKPIISVTLLADGKTVRIILMNRPVPGTDTVSVSGVRDLAGNFIDGPSHANVSIGSTDTTAPNLISAAWYDYNNTGFVEEEDMIVLYFDSVVQVLDCANDWLAVSPGAFELPVSADSFGDNLMIADAYPGDNWVVLQIGGNAFLTVSGTYSSSDNSTGAPSGIEIGATVNNFVQDYAGNDAAQGAAFDIEGAPLGPVQMDILNSSGLKLIGNASRFEVYHVTHADWTGMGQAGGFDPRHLQAFRGGVEIPLIINDNDDNSWDAGDELFILMPGYNDLYTRNDVAYLVYSPSVSEGLRFTDVSGAPSGSCSSQTMFLASEYERLTHEFGARFNPFPENDNPWVGSLITPGSGNSNYGFRTGFVAPAGGNASLSVRFYGVDDPGWPDTPHRVVGYLNGVKIIDDTSATGIGYFNVAVEFPSTLIDSDNDNLLQFAAPGVVGVDAVHVHSYQVFYNSSYTARDGGNYLFFSCTEDGDYPITGFSGTADGLVCWDISDLADPINIVYFDFDCGTLTINHSGGLKNYVAGYVAGAPTPLYANFTVPSLRNTSMSAEYVIISEESMFLQAQTLKTHRESLQGGNFQVEIIDIGKIFDEFSFGYENPNAIRQFLNYAYYHWALAPEYIMLLGDSTLDLDNGASSGRRNIIPTMWLDWSNSEPWIPSDQAIADATGRDLRADFKLGRIPAQSASEANAAIQKIVNYETLPLGGWETWILHVADVIGPEGDFPAFSSLLEMNYLGGYATMYYEAYANANVVTVRNSLNAGKLLACYLGTGDMTYWGPFPIFSTGDVPSLANFNRYPVTISAHNLTGFFMDRQLEGLAESMVVANGIGSVASVAPAVDADFMTEYEYIDEFYFRYFIMGIRRIGDLDEAARENVLQLGLDSNTYKVLRSYMLLGDPALQMR